ncbi:hypothetical protein [Sulfobacillus harzensis]|uniref:Uncharacterized protein n=1 Tax=Sulfobacillus harzensis TaxID=2729629 RepID=A0A7Y0L755_9FIRM|nr:hypothetical protein [Sulfobacillus harzensis]NMP23670.1 hypothetical protein [Sulfobacillus harzensis]
MRGVRLSRWSMSYFTVAVGSLLVAEALWASGLPTPLHDIGEPWVLAGVHLTTIGFLTLLMMGALHQFVPVLTETELASQSWSGITLLTVTTGLLGMVLGFLALPGGPLPPMAWLLPTGGSLVVLGVIMALINLGVTLKRAWPWALPAWLVATGLAYLLLTVLVGLLLALSLAVPDLFSAHQLSVMGGRGLASHVMAGVGGWLTLTAMGVSYKLLAMFTLSDEHRGIWGWTAYVATALGILAAWLSRWLDWNRVADVAWIVVLIGLALYLWDMRALYRARKRRQLELNARYGVIPLSFLGALVVAGIVVRLGGALARIDIALVFFALYGWLGGLALTQLYKIIPFLTWLNQFGNRMGKGRVPRVQELVNEPRDRYAYIVYFSMVILGTVSLAVRWFEGFRLAEALAFIATLDIARALYQAAHPVTQPSPSGTPQPGGIR